MILIRSFFPPSRNTGLYLDVEFAQFKFAKKLWKNVKLPHLNLREASPLELSKIRESLVDHAR